VKTAKESEPARVTHGLENAEGETSQDSKRKQAGEGYSQTGGHRGRNKSKTAKKKASEKRAPTGWRAQREGKVRTLKESK